MSALDLAVSATLPLVPRALVARLARPYIAGETLDDALATVRGLSDEGAMATLDVLGEEVGTPEEAGAVANAYRDALDRIEGARLDANVSVKLTGLGYRVDPELSEQSLRRLVARAADIDNFVRVDMEDSTMTGDTLAIYRRLREEGYGNVGVVLQARLHRTLEDAERLAAEGVNARVVKGIYLERETIAHSGRRVIQDAYMSVVETLLGAGCYAAIATHDRQLVDRSLGVVNRLGLRPDQYEFQMLLGVAPRLRAELIAEGHRVRVYVPFGRAWYEYSVRRLRENPAMAGHVLRNLFAPKA